MKEKNPGVKWFNTEFYPQKRTGRAFRYEDGILPRMRKESVTLFTPWGPRYSYKSRGILIEERDKEMQLLKFLREIFESMVNNMPQTIFRIIFLGADLYGTRINTLPEEVVDDYFSSLEDKLLETIPYVEFFRWSDFDEEAAAYREKAVKELDDIINPKIQARAVATARKMGNGGDAKEYLVERLAEAIFIEEKFSPVKISCVPRHKDDGVDFELPRLYLVPQELHAPWL